MLAGSQLRWLFWVRCGDLYPSVTHGNRSGFWKLTTVSTDGIIRVVSVDGTWLGWNNLLEASELEHQIEVIGLSRAVTKAAAAS